MLAPRVKLHSTPAAAVAVGVASLRLRPGDLFVDVGCGDGRVLVAAAAAAAAAGGGVECVGLEIDAARGAEAAAAVAAAGFDRGAARVVVGNALESLPQLEAATAVWLFLVPHGLRAVTPSLARGPPKRVATYLYPIPGVAYKSVEWVLVRARARACLPACWCGGLHSSLRPPQTKAAIADCKCPVYYYEFPAPVVEPSVAAASVRRPAPVLSTDPAPAGSAAAGGDELRAAMGLYVLACAGGCGERD